MDIFKHGRLSL
jgi:hypothetical protein